MAMDASKELNFDEAVANTPQLYEAKGLPESVQEVFANAKCDGANGSNKFWLAAKAIKVFFEKYQRLPVAGSVPDMTSTTEMYLAIQDVYFKKGVADLEECTAILQSLFDSAGSKLFKFDEYLETLKICCKNARYM